ncbi:MAG TPA: hypothetical protein PKD72_09105, partial [Gemmatales bacterium]|nr:hypothetical protein [Gemmatales bacterium]
YRRNKGHLLAGNNLAWLMAQEMQDVHEAYRILQEIRQGKHRLKPMPGDQLPPDVLDTFGPVYLKLNKPELGNERVELFEAAYRRYANNPRIAYHLGLAFGSVRDSRRAVQALLAARTLLIKSNLPADMQKQLNEQIQLAMREVENSNKP